MNSYFFIYKSIGISWFLFLTIISIIISYYITIFIGKDRGFKKNEAEDIFFILVISGFIGARLGYVVCNLDLYKGHLKYIFSINHINLSLLGGVIAGLITLIIISKKNKFSFYYLFKIFLIPFYFSMSLAIWFLFFEGRLIGKEYNGFLSIYHLSAYRHPVVLYLSLIFIVGLVIEAINIKRRILGKYISYLVFVLILISYYLIRIKLAI
ncbi:prolipoprotein diacylglyceryl transferase family protein [Caloranaerobacter ferrireducens]|uniref:prolipoprotein diacylglyceryl transferase family protein n=1 Tax=Caloranaerobacter ferrireducens TaxID=1323370 RepID=UPI00084DF38C|nr:prolipoprotein diacylglyceryl transferase family protein [Caloranaerobacter ferrireducens]